MPEFKPRSSYSWATVNAFLYIHLVHIFNVHLLYEKPFRNYFGMRNGIDAQCDLLNFQSILILEEDEIHA